MIIQEKYLPNFEKGWLGRRTKWITGVTYNVSITLGIFYRPSSQNNDTSELFFEEPRNTSKSTALVLLEDFSLAEINWQHHTGGTAQARRFLKYLDGNFMEHVLRETNSKRWPPLSAYQQSGSHE